MSSSSNQMKIFIAGISGMLGHQIAEEILNKKKDVKLVGILRKRSNETDEQKKNIEKLEKLGAEIVEGDVCKPDTYSNHLKDVNVIISALQGGSECIIDAQKKLYSYGLKKGNLKMFIPSDFACDLFNIPKQEHPWLGWRREFAEWVDSRKDNVKIVHMLNGCFMDVFFSEFLGMCDMNSSPRKLNYYGSENTKIDLTTTRDTAKFVAEAVFDKDPPSRFCIAGDVVTLKQIAETFNKYNGEGAMKLNKLGNIDDLEKKLNEMREKFKSDERKWVPFAYQLSLLKDNRGKLTNLMNDRYSNIKTTSLSEYLQTEKFSSG